MKLYSALYSTFHPFNKWEEFDSFQCVTSSKELTEPGVLVLHGGEDISPFLYNKGRSSMSGARSTTSRRDDAEWELLQGAFKRGMPIIGICRGAQMLCAAAGGYLIQHVDNHGRDHTITTINGDEAFITSCHHQQMWPYDVEHTLLAWSEKRGTIYLDVNDDVIDKVEKDPEWVWFPSIKGLAVQNHPEWEHVDSGGNVLIHQFFKQYIGELVHE